jgi:SAM-dependent methyltransferase
MAITKTQKFQDINESKANFDRIYQCNDPREYYRVLHGLDYIIPDLAKPLFHSVVEAATAARGHAPRVLDLGCSYGINAALLRYPLDLERLGQRYRDFDLIGMSSSKVTELDRKYFASWPTEFEGVITGLDVAAPAIRYAKAAGLLDHGIAEDFEKDDPSPAAREVLAGTDLVISTGCVGYVGERTFERILKSAGGSQPWIASFVLRMFSYKAIEDALARHGYVTERLEGITFVQRRFHSASEAEETLGVLHRQDIDTTGKESEGLLHAEFFLSRPEAEAVQAPLPGIVSITSGASRSYGRRFRMSGDHRIRLIK